MAQYFYSIPSQDILRLDLIVQSLKDRPARERDYLPAALRNPIKGIIDVIKSDAAVCLDPHTGNITIDQIRMYAYKDYYKMSDVEAREELVKKFIAGSKEPYKDFAEKRTERLDWKDDMEFKEAMEDILVEYEARAAYDPERFPPYGMIFRHTYTMQLTRQGLEKTIYCENKTDYFTDEKYHAEHMKRVSNRYNELRACAEVSHTTKEDVISVLKDKNEPFFELFEKANGRSGGADYNRFQVIAAMQGEETAICR